MVYRYRGKPQWYPPRDAPRIQWTKALRQEWHMYEMANRLCREEYRRTKKLITKHENNPRS